jgi:hypothetical protein
MVLGLWAMSIFRNSKQLESTTCRKLGLFLSSCEVEGDICSVGSLRKS